MLLPMVVGKDLQLLFGRYWWFLVDLGIPFISFYMCTNAIIVSVMTTIVL